MDSLRFHREPDSVTIGLAIDEVLCLTFGPILQTMAATQLWTPDLEPPWYIICVWYEQWHLYLRSNMQNTLASIYIIT